MLRNKKEHKKIKQGCLFSPSGQEGFTLIELLVAMVVFTIVISSVVALFGNALKTQNEVLSYSQTLSSASYSIEYVARALRMAKKDLLGTCITSKSNYENIGNTTIIRFLNYDGKCQEFGLSTGAIYLRKSLTNSSAGLGALVPLTASNLVVSKLVFNITGNSQVDDFQPKVALALEIGELNKEFAPIKVQTTISQRDLDIPQ
ncbi:prepilin-type N-terminal cleavage/methylation domain-containing protein [Candidatus Parcubacteria bacterium]|nr:prepilin-type N-terminal cleavage/methylation domain-containing protein [Candidatus Parcubacteria bacterium]